MAKTREKRDQRMLIAIRPLSPIVHRLSRMDASALGFRCFKGSQMRIACQIYGARAVTATRTTASLTIISPRHRTPSHVARAAPRSPAITLIGENAQLLVPGPRCDLWVSPRLEIGMETISTMTITETRDTRSVRRCQDAVAPPRTQTLSRRSLLFRTLSTGDLLWRQKASCHWALQHRRMIPCRMVLCTLPLRYRRGQSL
jgi:hypothetical protein